MNISVIIPVYNDSSQLSTTVDALLSAISTTENVTLEIIIVDDGSTQPVSLADITDSRTSVTTSILHQVNSGRFVARYRGISRAKYENVLLIDARVNIGKESLRYLVSQQSVRPDRKVWSGHVNMGGHSIYGNLMDSLTKTVWRAYFAHPRLMSYGLPNFDKYPKGTTMFFAPKQILIEAFEKTLAEARGSIVVSDDTRMIRRIVSTESIWLSPDFCCTYTPRNISGNMLNHMWHRGEVFYDGYKNTKNRLGNLLRLILLLTPIAIGLIILKPIILMAMFALLYIGIIMNAIYSQLNMKHIFAQCCLLPLYLVLFIGGIWKAFIRDVFADRLQLIHNYLAGAKR